MKILPSQLFHVASLVPWQIHAVNFVLSQPFYVVYFSETFLLIVQPFHILDMTQSGSPIFFEHIAGCLKEGRGDV